MVRTVTGGGCLDDSQAVADVRFRGATESFAPSFCLEDIDGA
jgi:hypothetical protein